VLRVFFRDLKLTGRSIVTFSTCRDGFHRRLVLTKSVGRAGRSSREQKLHLEAQLPVGTTLFRCHDVVKSLQLKIDRRKLITKF
jgi:hypothetical protein